MKKFISAFMFSNFGKRSLFWVRMMTAALVTIFPAFCRAQAEPDSMPSFDAASIRSKAQCYQSVSKPPERAEKGEVHAMKLFRPFPPSFQPGGRYQGCASLIEFIMDAYQIEPWQVTGGPDWIRKSDFQIEARAEMNAERSQMRLMLQSLLAERFNLKMHRQRRETEVYSLVVAEGSHKLKAALDEHGKPITAPLTAEDIRKKYEDAMRNNNLYEAVSGIGPSNSGDGYRTSMSDKTASTKSLATRLRKYAGKIVIDKTGLSGIYDFELSFRDDSPGVISLRQRYSILPHAGSEDAPPLNKAIVEQLGLKLVPDKAQLDFYVIDSVDMPSKN